MIMFDRWCAGVVGPVVALVAAAGCAVSDRTPDGGRHPARPAVVAFRVPAEGEIDDSATLASLRRGRALLHDTRDSLPGHVGNRLACVSCHVDDGTRKNVMPLVGVYARFPQYRSRGARIDLIEDRVNDCFERSMNGRGLDAVGREMRDIVTYLAFLSRGVPAGAHVEGEGLPALDPLEGDTVRGATLFAATCAACHGADGHGTVAGPPLWGVGSFNIGAGLARLRTAAAFIRVAMPKTNPGSLSPQQAFDLARYVTTRARPDFARKALDWPRGDAPPDAAYPTNAARARGGGSR